MGGKGSRIARGTLTPELRAASSLVGSADLSLDAPPRRRAELRKLRQGASRRASAEGLGHRTRVAQ